jgi:hypothetical protein
MLQHGYVNPPASSVASVVMHSSMSNKDIIDSETHPTQKTDTLKTVSTSAGLSRWKKAVGAAPWEPGDWGVRSGQVE